jgi:hypothetical protein
VDLPDGGRSEGYRIELCKEGTPRLPERGCHYALQHGNVSSEKVQSLINIGLDTPPFAGWACSVRCPARDERHDPGPEEVRAYLPGHGKLRDV